MTINWRAAKYVVFDAVGTLMRAQPGVAEAYFSAGQMHGSRYPLAQVADRFRLAFKRFHSLASQGESHSDAVERERWRQTVGFVFNDVTSRADELFDFLWNHFGDPRNWSPFDDVRQAFNRLLAAGKTVVIGSNFDRRLHAIAAVHFPRCPVFCSSLLGASKPSQDFYRAIETALDARADSVLMVGDDLDNDFHAPCAAGWQAILLDRNDTAASVSPRINSLLALDPAL